MTFERLLREFRRTSGFWLRHLCFVITTRYIGKWQLHEKIASNTQHLKLIGNDLLMQCYRADKTGRLTRRQKTFLPENSYLKKFCLHYHVCDRLLSHPGGSSNVASQDSTEVASCYGTRRWSQAEWTTWVHWNQCRLHLSPFTFPRV